MNKTRTRLTISGSGFVRCWCGTIGDFIEDLSEFIVPLLEDDIVAKFNDRKITVSPYDNVTTLTDKFKKVWRDLKTGYFPEDCK